ncbi:MULTISPECIES: endopeptidase [unclassified Streptomyces]|uniref:trypsin-like serine peptidase n=1 Tax=unclassified Streptomyces TaxID=2593676 RepID=UPI0023658F7E|nr:MULTISPECIES: endopeptidase [unclassified Streptomyces]MDF3142912.1 endopeptidase [Streptomyces sp. T21Q-yed]WDF39229.1 endopeptidase [Streptomyces sp. T12]
MPHDPHNAVSNEPEDVTVSLAPEQEAVLQPPSEGAQGEVLHGTGEGLEPVEGYRRPEGFPPEAWTAPTVALPDIGEASFGPPPSAQKTVHGPDDRVQITNTAVYPWRVHCYLLITARDNTLYQGTGWLVGPHTVATAGHCVYIKGSGVAGRDGWVKSIQVMPGRNGSVLPYGSVTCTSFRSVVGWTDDGDDNFDYGAIVTPSNIGSTTGWFGFGVWSDSDLLKTTGNIAGYPGDKPPGTLWYAARGVDSVTARKVYYDIDTAGGQSGSSVYRIDNGNRYGFAIHAYGGARVNSGTRFTTPVYNNYVAWKA